MSEQTYVINSLTLDTASRTIAGAITKTAERGLTVTVAATDPEGILKTFQGMEGASVVSADIPVNNAFTALTSGFNAGGFFELAKTDLALLHGMTEVPRFPGCGGEHIPLAGVAALLGE